MPSCTRQRLHSRIGTMIKSRRRSKSCSISAWSIFRKDWKADRLAYSENDDQLKTGIVSESDVAIGLTCELFRVTTIAGFITQRFQSPGRYCASCLDVLSRQVQHALISQFLLPCAGIEMALQWLLLDKKTLFSSSVGDVFSSFLSAHINFLLSVTVSLYISYRATEILLVCNAALYIYIYTSACVPARAFALPFARKRFFCPRNA